MEIDKEFDKVNEYFRKLDPIIKKENTGKLELHETEQNIKTMETLLTRINKSVSVSFITYTPIQLKSIEDELEDKPNKSYSSQLKSQQNELKIKQKTFDQIKSKFERNNNIDKYKRGELSGTDARKAERNIIQNLHAETDVQGEMINDIAKDIRDANQNLNDVAVEVDKQGEQLLRIDGGLTEARAHVDNADKNISDMNRRIFCIKFLLHVVDILLFIGIIVVAIIWLKPKKEQTS